MPKSQGNALVEKTSNRIRKLLTYILENHTSTFAVTGALAGGHMIGKLPESSELPFPEIFAWLMLIILALLMLCFNYYYEKAIFNKNGRAVVKYRTVIISSSIILSLANHYSPYFRR